MNQAAGTRKNRGGQRRSRRASARTLVLRVVALTGVLAVAAIAPKSLRLLKKLDRGAARRTELYRRISQATNKLISEGLLVKTGSSKNERMKLTEKGKAYVDRLYANEYQIPEPAFWDGQWRIVMFDMREKRRGARFKLRSLLRNAGFVRLQDSVWVYPYPCDEFVTLLRSHLKSGTGEMLSLTAEAIENDRGLREHFRLA